jgi:general secretion pathway protein C
MFARLSAFVIWSLVAATAVFWVLRLAAGPAPVPPYAVAVGTSVAVRGDLSRLFGAPQRASVVAQATPEAPSRYKLVGVMAPRSPAVQAEAGQGLALIAVDGKPAKAFAVGARVDSDLVLQSVGLRTASIGPAQGSRSVLLELPALAPPNSGVLPPAGMSAPVTPAPVPPAPLPAQRTQAVPQFAPSAPLPGTTVPNVQAVAPPAVGVPHPPAVQSEPAPETLPAPSPSMPMSGSANTK